MSLPMSLKDKIRRNRRQWTQTAIAQAAIITAETGLHLADLLSTRAWLSLAGLSGLYLAWDLIMLTQVIRTQRFYNANPAAAYVAEIRNAFGPPASNQAADAIISNQLKPPASW